MKLLLDTHVLLWWWLDSPQLPASARALMADEANPVFVSAASAWEIATKHRLGKLPGAEAVLPRFHELIRADGFQHLPITWAHAVRAGGYELAHRDPFDRMLAAQAEWEQLTLLTRDPAFALFDTPVAW
ncbi:MAG: type II toxin-antitoxin system VapC family toxin [Proteobacteria bacterium]|uniref:type II toxin-antitoxin system VapC family toxin n=1 Tax=Ottowia sp. TaxID=1898956 RepID=UPI0025EF4591|nr:type II toxin-antitoxin system VapC family toxin [Ottowia sp.]MBS0415495.1 type II toxin-antitoxin system VapC family toxin [Pseudomonadota bacterium]